MPRSTIPGTYSPKRSPLRSPYPLLWSAPRIPLPNRSSLYSAGGLTFSSPPPQQPHQPRPVSNNTNDLSAFEYIALGLAGGVWMGANFVCRSIGSALNYAASSFGYPRSTISAGTVENPKPTRRTNRDHRHDPLGARVRPRSPITSKATKPLKSALAPRWRRPSVAPGTPVANNGDALAGNDLLGVLPHNAGAAPPVIANERRFHAHQSSMDVVADADGDIQMGGVTPPIRELPPRPHMQASKAKTGKKVRFADPLEDETKDGAVGVPVLDTRAIIQNPPTGAEGPPNSLKRFYQKKYKRWVDFLRSQGISVKEYGETLKNELALPTDVIMRLYSQQGKTPEHWHTLIACLSHDGFLEKMGIAVPKQSYGPPPTMWEPDELPLRIPYDSPYQQRDGRCCFCRGFKWAGEVETRRIAQYGDEVECRSQHRSVVPYTERELADFRKGVFDSFWRRCCQESRWDWIFEEPAPNGPRGLEWQIPQWDIRLRHFRRFKNPLTGEAFGEGLFLPKEEQLLELYELQAKLSRQDLAAKLFIDAVEEAGNEQLARNLRKMDKERKRKQVQTEFLCVRQVRLAVGAAGSLIPEHAPKKPAAPKSSESSHVADPEEARRAAEWAKFEKFKERHEVMHGQKMKTHYTTTGLDPEEFAMRRNEYDQHLWKEFLAEEKCLQEEKEQDEQLRIKRQQQQPSSHEQARYSGGAKETGSGHQKPHQSIQETGGITTLPGGITP